MEASASLGDNEQSSPGYSVGDVVLILSKHLLKVPDILELTVTAAYASLS